MMEKSEGKATRAERLREHRRIRGEREMRRTRRIVLRNTAAAS